MTTPMTDKDDWIDKIYYLFIDSDAEDLREFKAAIQQHIQAEKIADTSKVTRFEVIDHTKDGTGRDFVKYGVSVELSLQDNNRTLKVFLSDPAHHN